MTALVAGAGPIGLSVLLALRAHGFSGIIISELSGSRKELARDFGADQVIDPREEDLVSAVRAATGGRGADVSFDASGVGSRISLSQVLDQGILHLLGGGATEVKILVTPGTASAE